MITELFCQGYNVQLNKIDPYATDMSQNDILAEIFLYDYFEIERYHSEKKVNWERVLFKGDETNEFHIGAIYEEEPNRDQIRIRIIYSFPNKISSDNGQLDTTKNGLVNFLFKEENGNIKLYVFGITFLTTQEVANKIYNEVIELLNVKLSIYGYRIEATEFEVDDTKTLEFKDYASDMKVNLNKLIFFVHRVRDSDYTNTDAIIE